MATSIQVWFARQFLSASDSDPVFFEDPVHDPPVQFQSSSNGFTLQQVIWDQMVRSLFTIIRDIFEIEWLVSLPGAEIDSAEGAQKRFSGPTNHDILCIVL